MKKTVLGGTILALAMGLTACSSSPNPVASSTTTAPVPSTNAPTTNAPTTVAPPPTSVPTASAAPCTAAALQAALPAGSTIVTTDLGFNCEGGYAGAEINVVPTGGGGAAGAITTDTLFRAENSTWVVIGRSAANCAAVPASVHVYCTVS
jgi:hypothetical protein